MVGFVLREKTSGPLRFYARLALKNLLRHKRRTIITALAMALGIAMYTGMDSVLLGFSSQADRNMVDYEVGSAAVVAPGYWEERERFPLDMLVENPQPLLRELAAAGIPAAPRTSVRGELIIHYDPFPEDGSLTMAVTGVDPKMDPDVFRLAAAVREGRWLHAGHNEVVIGRWLADQLGAEVGYPVDVATRTRDGYRQLIDLEIVGIYEAANPYVDRFAIHIPLDVADTYLEMRGAVTSLHVALPESIPGTADITPLREALDRSGITGAEALSYRELTREFGELMEMQHAYTNVLLFLLALIAIVGVSNTMLMSVLERYREIGMLRSMGMHNGEIRLLFSLEAAGIAVVGAMAGVVISTLLVWLATTWGINYNKLMEGVDMSGYRFDGVLYGVWNVETMVTATVFAILVAALVAILPTGRILKQSVSDCLRHV